MANTDFSNANEDTQQLLARLDSKYHRKARAHLGCREHLLSRFRLRTLRMREIQHKGPEHEAAWCHVQPCHHDNWEPVHDITTGEKGEGLCHGPTAVVNVSFFLFLLSLQFISFM